MLFLILAAALQQAPTIDSKEAVDRQPTIQTKEPVVSTKTPSITAEERQDIQDLIDESRKVSVESKAKTDLLNDQLGIKIKRIEAEHPGLTVDPKTLNLVTKREPNQSLQIPNGEIHPKHPLTPAPPIPRIQDKKQ